MPKKRPAKAHPKASAAKAHAKRAQGTNRAIVVVLFAVVAIGALAFLASAAPASAPVAAAAPARTLARISPQDYQSKFADTAAHVLIDVRTPAEFKNGHIANAVNISVETLASRLSEVPQGVPVVVYCRSGNRSATAARILADAGFSEVYDLGGLIEWQRLGYPIRY